MQAAKYNVAYLLRQHFAHNLGSRFDTRPFLTPVERRWIVYQILRALRQCEVKGVQHGDIKRENVALTSWDWVLLTDFASFKPVYLSDSDQTGA